MGLIVFRGPCFLPPPPSAPTKTTIFGGRAARTAVWLCRDLREPFETLWAKIRSVM